MRAADAMSAAELWNRECEDFAAPQFISCFLAPTATMRGREALGRDCSMFGGMGGQAA
jgi:hypothetical protein